MVSFAKSQHARCASAQMPNPSITLDAIPLKHRRKKVARLPELSELQTVRHYTTLAQKNFSIDTNPYFLGSCTMKYNPRGVHRAASHPDLLARHPLLPEKDNQWVLHGLFQLQEYLIEITGMCATSLTPMAGSQGEFAGVAMIRAYHEARGDTDRTEIIVPDAAHGTNPASAIMCGYQVREIATGADGDIDLNQLQNMVGPQTAGIMLTNPSTCGVFERKIQDVAKCIHDAGGLLYYDGANLNAILGKVRPGDMGFDVMHLNLHKTFATPHGGGGPGAGPVAVGKRLAPFLPTPIVVHENNQYVLHTDTHRPQTIGRLSAFMGNTAILLRAYFYIRMLGRTGLKRVAEFATLNANYLMHLLEKNGFDLAYPNRRASHEFIITLEKQKKDHNVTAMDVAKRLLDYGVHAPTSYFPLLIPECFLIEPTETESVEDLEQFASILGKIKQELENDPEWVRTAPHNTPVARIDEVKAARELDLNYWVTHDKKTATPNA